MREKQLYEPRKFEHLFGTPGFSDRLLKDHFKLYEGYVKNTNEWVRSSGSPEDKRRFGWEFNGMRLHEYYFENMGRREPMEKNGGLSRKISDDFGSVQNWRADFLTIGAMRGIGWAVLAYDETAEKLFNLWIDGHNTGHLAGTVPLLVMDVFEHAYLTDYGLDRGKYLSAFWDAISWEKVQDRFECAGKAVSLP